MDTKEVPAGLQTHKRYPKKEEKKASSETESW